MNYIFIIFLSILTYPVSVSVSASLLPNTSFGVWDGFKKLAGCYPGENVTGLAELKKYLQYFGYINNSTASFTDDFDDHLETAVKTYQRNFNLNETGQLDEPTVTQIMLPRCGVSDIVNGSSTMNAGRAPSASSVYPHDTVAHYSFFDGSPRWPAAQTVLTYSFFPANQLRDNVKLVFSRAFDRWSAVTSFTFRESSSYSSADIRIGFFSGDHGDRAPFDGKLGVLAHAFAPPNGRLHLDNSESWVFDQAIPLNAVDLQSVAVHEIGHVLGLGHSSIEEAIMFPSIDPGTRKVELANDDIQGIQTLYGLNPNTGPTMATLRQERDTSGAYIISPTWILVVILSLFVL